MHPDFWELKLRALVDDVALQRLLERLWVELDETWQILRMKRGCRR